MGSGTGPSKSWTIFFAALELIRARFRDDTLSDSDKRSFNYVLDISRTYRPNCTPRHVFEENFAAWQKFAGYRLFHQRLKDWIEELESLFSEIAPERYMDPVYEVANIQLGEMALRALVLTDKSFVPYYVRMLRVWNCTPGTRGDHVDIVIEEIVDKYGLCVETEELIEYVYGYWRYEGFGLGRLLKQLHGDLPNNPLFRRIVASQNDWFALCRAEDYRKIMERLRANPNAPIGGRAEERWVFRDDKYSGIWEDADIVLAELDAVALTKP